MYRINKFSFHFLCCFLKSVFSMFPENYQCSVLHSFLKKHPDASVYLGFVCIKSSSIPPFCLFLGVQSYTRFRNNVDVCNDSICWRNGLGYPGPSTAAPLPARSCLGFLASHPIQNLLGVRPEAAWIQVSLRKYLSICTVVIVHGDS